MVFPVPPALRAPYRPPAHGAAAASLGVEGALCTRVTLWQRQPHLTAAGPAAVAAATGAVAAAEAAAAADHHELRSDELDVDAVGWSMLTVIK